MTDASHATPGPLPPQPRRSQHGCLFGCLFAALIAITAIVGAFSYFGWYFYSGFKENPTLAMVMTVVNGDERARSVLGDNIRITALHSSSIIEDTNTGTHEAYIASVKGSKAEGSLSVSVDSTGKMKRITSLILTGPDGRSYDLTSSRPHDYPDSI